MKYVYTLACLLAIAACSAGNGSKDSSTSDDTTTRLNTTVKLPAPETGKVTDTVDCGKGQTYAVYLPASYNAEQAMPLLLFFDAHARGSLPVRAYKKVADEMGCVLAGSNNSKNGLDANSSLEIATRMLGDLRSRLNIDSRRIYTCGFSGGARVASSFALEKGGIAGVIGCGAGFPSSNYNIASKFHFVGIAGDGDFNLPELLLLDNQLQTAGFQHTLIEYQGRHAWPPVSIFKLAITALNNNNAGMGNGDMQIAGIYADELQKSGKIVSAVRLLDGTLSCAKANANNAALQQKSTEWKNNPLFNTQLEEEKAANVQEQKLNQELGALIMTQDLKWWSAKISELRNKSKGSSPTAAMHRRVINFLGLISYMATSRFLAAGNLSKADNTRKIFRMLDPQNPDGWYLECVYYVKNNDAHNALIALKKCAEAGYNQPADMAEDTDLTPLHQAPEFAEILKMVNRNYFEAKLQ